MPIYKLKHEMTYEELLGWINYFERRPVGWRDDDRAHKIMQTNGCEVKATEIFSSLTPIYKPANKLPDGMIDPNNLKGSVLFQKMLGAVGGDKLDL